MYPQLFFSSETAKIFSYPYKMFWKFFVPLQKLLKIFRTPTQYTPPRRPALKMTGP